MYEAFVETPRRPTESGAKVRRAILNLFPEARLEEGEGISGAVGSLDRLGELLRKQRIRDSARELLSGATRGDRLVFYLNKQAAYAGRVSFSAHAPLGDICVTVIADDIRGLIEELAPSTLGPGRGEPRPAP